MKKSASVSELLLWERDPVEYVERYVNGKEIEPTRDMILGKHIHALIESPEYPIVEKMKADGFKGDSILKVQKVVPKVLKAGEPEVGINAELYGEKLYGVMDRFDKENRILTDYKTTKNKDRWNQRLVDLDKQLSFYAMMYYLTYFSYFREITLCRILTGKEYTSKTFYTARSYRDVEWIKDWTMKQINEIKKEGLWSLRKSRKEIEEMKKEKLI